MCCQENHSFDNYFGSLAGLPAGYGIPAGGYFDHIAPKQLDAFGPGVRNHKFDTSTPTTNNAAGGRPFPPATGTRR